MSDDRPWGSMDPNSQHQLWSEWTFTIREGGKHVPFRDVKDNAVRWIKKGFGSVGQMRIEEKLHSYIIVVQVEGVAANDPEYVMSVRRQFQQWFVAPGWGPLAHGTTIVRILAGDSEDKPRSQLVVMPTLR